MKATTIDSLLVDRIQNGDPSAMDALFNRYQNRLKRYALKLTRDVDDANDLLSEAMIRSYRALYRFRKGSSITTWLYRILKNCFIDTVKKAQIKNTVSIDTIISNDEFSIYPQFVDQTADTEAIVFLSISVSRLLDFVDRLDASESKLIRMYCIDQLTYNEISQRLGMPLGTIKSRLNRARSNLQLIVFSSSSDVTQNIVSLSKDTEPSTC